VLCDCSGQSGGTDLPSLSAMLTTVVSQCIECLADPMWELRRMAGQVPMTHRQTLIVLQKTHTHTHNRLVAFCPGLPG